MKHSIPQSAFLPTNCDPESTEEIPVRNAQRHLGELEPIAPGTASHKHPGNLREIDHALAKWEQKYGYRSPRTPRVSRNPYGKIVGFPHLPAEAA
jgi:hypothetical protein